MSQTDLKLKISVEAQLAQLRAMEAQFQRQITQLRETPPKTGMPSFATPVQPCSTLSPQGLGDGQNLNPDTP